MTAPTHSEQGLTTDEARERLARFGPNRPDPGRSRSFVAEALRLFADPLVLGPVSSIFDFLIFAVLLHVFHAGAVLFHTGWFVESLATQTLVLFVIRTGRNPFRSRPSRALTVTILAVVVVGLWLPFSPLAAPLGFTPLPIGFLLTVFLMTAAYLALVEAVKRRLLGQAIV